jgi:hypothetical protein
MKRERVQVAGVGEEDGQGDGSGVRGGTGARSRQAHAGFGRSKKREDEALRRYNLPVCKIGWKRQINRGRRGRRCREMEPVVERGQRHEKLTQDCAATE